MINYVDAVIHVCLYEGVGKFGLDRFETYSQTDPNLSFQTDINLKFFQAEPIQTDWIGLDWFGSSV